MKKETWILAANKTQARIFKLEKGLNPVEIETLVHTESRLRAQDLVGDKPGATYEGAGHARRSMEQQTMPKEFEAQLFAKQVAGRLVLARAQDKLERLYIAASPHFLGLLRRELDPLTEKILMHTVDKDLTLLEPKAILQYFPIGI